MKFERTQRCKRVVKQRVFRYTIACGNIVDKKRQKHGDNS